MISQSVWLMTVFDCAIILVVLYSARIFLVVRQEIRDLQLRGAYLAVLSGLSILALFYFVDLLAMHVLPRFISMTTAKAFMESIHLNHRWMVALIAVGLIALGTALSSRRHAVLHDMLRKSGEALRDSEARLGTMLDSVIEGVFTIDERGTIESLNPAAERMFGYGAEEVAGRNVNLLMPEPDRGRHDGYVSRYLETGEARIIGGTREVTGLRKDGTAFPLELGIAEMRLGERRYFVGTLRDITERKRAEQALRESEARLSAFIDHSPAAISFKDRDGRFILINPAYERLVGMSGEEVLGKTSHDIFNKDFANSVVAHDKTVLDEDRAIEWEGTFEAKDGLHTWITCKFPVHDAAGAIVAIAAIGFEITERKRAEEALRESEEKFRTVLDHSPAKIHIKDLEGRYLLVNKKAEELFGLTDQEARGKTTHELFPKERADHFTAHDRAVLETGQVVEQEEEWLREDGVHTFLTIKFPIRDAAAKVIAVGAIGTDVTERKAAEAEKARLEAQLRQAQKMEAVGTLAGGIAHDFNNILAGMVGYAHLAIEAVPAESQVRGDLEELMNGIDRATSLVQQILAFSRRSDVERHPVAIGRIVAEAVRLIRASIPSTIEIRSQIDREAGTVIADATQLQQVVMNLCANAADAIGQAPGRIEVALARVELNDADTADHPDLVPGSYVRLSVDDTGAGMDAATRQRVFEPFFTTKEPGQGTGLGLSVVHGIVREHGGAIEIDSEPGRATRLTVLLPRTEAAEQGAAGPDRGIPRGSERILLVDDEAAIVRSEKRLLERLGYRVEVATSGAGALQAFRAAPNAFDMVVTDQAMPELPGVALAQELLKVRPDMPIILRTGYTDALGEEDALSAGIREFMMKPIRPDDLARAVRRVLDGDVCQEASSRITAR